MHITLDKDDEAVILAYFTQEQRKAGYTGVCAVNVHRLDERHMVLAELITTSALTIARRESRRQL